MDEKKTPGQRIDQGKPAGQYQPDFSQCRTLSDVLRTALTMRDHGAVLRTSSGQEQTPQVLAERITRVVELVRSARIRSAIDQQVSGSTPMLDEVALDGMLSSNGISSSAGLRDALARMLNRSGEIRLDGDFGSTSDNLLQRGDYNPIWQLPIDEFIRRYPRDRYAGEPANNAEDTELQIFQRWKKNQATRRATYEQQSESWRRGRKTMEFPQQGIVHPGSTDHYTRYAAVQGGIASELTQARQRREQRVAQGHTMLEGGFVEQSVAARIGQLLCGGRKVLEYNGYNLTLSAEAPSRTDQAAVRTLVIPLEGRPGKSMIVNLFSQIEDLAFGVQAESDTGFRGVMVEDIAGFGLLSGQKLKPDQFADFGAAHAQLLAVEAQVRDQFGLELGLTADLVKRFAPQR